MYSKCDGKLHTGAKTVGSLIKLPDLQHWFYSIMCILLPNHKINLGVKAELVSNGADATVHICLVIVSYKTLHALYETG